MSSTGCLIPSVNALFAGLSALSSLFFMIGALGYTDKGSVMEDIAWIKADFYGSKYYFSLSAVYYDFGNLPVQTLEDCAPYSNYCDYCMNDGHSAYVMTVIACLTAIIAATLSVFLVKYSDFLYLHYALIAVAGFSFLMAAIALCVFMGDCQRRTKKADKNNSEYSWGPGSILVAVGMVMMFAVMIGTVVIVKVGGIDNHNGGGRHKDGFKGEAVPDEPADGEMINPLQL